MNHLKPVEIFQATVSTGITKVNNSAGRLLIMGILAGVYIAFAGVAANMAAFNLLGNSSTFGLGKALSGIVFAGGLTIVLLAGAELFTGNALIFAGVLEKKITLRSMFRNWGLVYAGNFMGAVLIAYMFYLTGGLSSGEGMLGAVTLKIAAGKVNLSFLQAFISGILCNWLVCLAVWMSTGAASTCGKVTALIFPIWLFVISGFEHSVANMYFIPAGIFALKNEAFYIMSGLSESSITDLNWKGMCINNLLPVTLGNIIGGAFCVAFVYWLALKKCNKQML